MSDPGPDLRDADCFARWADSLPADLRSVLRQAAFAYFEFDDTISVVLPHTLEPVLRQANAYIRLRLEVASYYDAIRCAWMSDGGGALAGKTPLAVVMPRLRFETLPRHDSGH